MPPRTTIRDLPFELLERILDLAAGDADLDDKASLHSRNSFLKHAALTSQDLRYPAQSCLWKTIRVHNSDTAKKLLGSKCVGLFPTKHLSLEGVHSGSDGLSGPTASRVLRQVIGVRTLKLMDFGRLSLRVLQNENLSTLETLYLMSSFPDKSSTVTSLEFRFHLRTLHLFNRNYSLDLLPTLFRQSRSTLTSLTLITSPSSPSYPSLVEAFPQVATTLRHLSLQHRPSRDLTNEFSRCENLEELQVSSAVDLAEVLDSLALAKPRRLETVSVELDYNLVQVAETVLDRISRRDDDDDDDDDTDADNAGVHVLDRLKTLKFPRAPALKEFRDFGGHELLERCRERGIQVELGQVVAWRTRSVFDT